jgi:hypothetical protein
MIQRTGHPSPRSSARRAMLLISVLVCLTVVMMLFAGWVKSIALARQQVRAQEDRMQAEYLALSGLERAAAQLAADATYSGEIWRIGGESFWGRATAAVDIRVTPIPGESKTRMVRVVANFPAEGAPRARRSKEIKIVLTKPGGGP